MNYNANRQENMSPYKRKRDIAFQQSLNTKKVPQKAFRKSKKRERDSLPTKFEHEKSTTESLQKEQKGRENQSEKKDLEKSTSFQRRRLLRDLTKSTPITYLLSPTKQAKDSPILTSK